MKSLRIFAVWAALAVVAAPLLAGQPGAKIWLKAEVIRADYHAIVVREQGDTRKIHSFTYSPAVLAKMQKILAHGGYQYGDKVKILYQQGQTVALDIEGKPSKP